MQNIIEASGLSFSYADKELYRNVSFSIPLGSHCVLVGSNGTGKSTLLDILTDPDEYLYTGKIFRSPDFRIGYVNQFVQHDKDRDISVFEFLSEDFVSMQAETDALCAEMETAEDFESAAAKYQESLDRFDAVDGYNYESNIHKQLYLAGLTAIENVSVAGISGGEYKLLQVIRQMLKLPDFLIMDEPDAFLDFDNLSGLRDLINSYPGTLLAVTHNRYLLNHCFNRVLHLEDTEIREYDGSYTAYMFSLLQMKVQMQKAADKEEEWIRIQEDLVEKLRKKATEVANADYGRALRARVSYLERLNATRTKLPYLEDRIPTIRFMETSFSEDTDYVLRAENYDLTYEEELLKDVSFQILPGEKVALVGPNGTGKTSLLRDIWKCSSPAVSFGPDIRAGILSQLHGEVLDETKTIEELFRGDADLTATEFNGLLSRFGFPRDMADQVISTLSGGEKNLLQLAWLSLSDVNLLLLDEPTSHLDLYMQTALERAIQEYKGSVLMVSHDFYSIANCTDRVLFAENGTIRAMSGRAFRKMVYKKHFPKDYLAFEQEKKELELKINSALVSRAYDTAELCCSRLEELILSRKA